MLACPAGLLELPVMSNFLHMSLRVPVRIGDLLSCPLAQSILSLLPPECAVCTNNAPKVTNGDKHVNILFSRRDTEGLWLNLLLQ